ncbi:alkaline phosphatase [Catellatospora sp. TT07R-123]|uniref:discoidin domain-containing protein n=1 Tax=Catellatospora sp. TT07R-123 TaxID=2733863 RepID=UPI001B0FCACA|nr:discoidin domain-containing protein [Catellatospora sp. TT07R-123]GHJ43016.1 alkaline phosphatase [Catellatospora sp. TT07R-123]
MLSKKQFLTTAAAVTTALLTAAAVVLAQRAEAADVLLSRNRPVAASSSEASAYAPEKAVDGDTATRWASTEGSDPQWIRVDLGTVTPITRVRLVWEAAYASAYRLETSADAATWTTLKSVTGENGGTDDHTGLTATARYLRVYGTQRGTAYGYSLWELEVYGPGAPPAPGTDYQAEDAALSQAAVATNHTGYTGTGFVDYTNVTGGWIEWTVTAATAGPVALTVRYANGTTANRPMDVAVDGAVAAESVDFAPTANWDTWTTRTVTATLAAGTHTVRATAVDAAGGPNVDRLTVAPAATASPTAGPSAGPSPTPGGAFTAAAAGDIAEQCTASSSTCQHPKTAALVTAMNPDLVLTMGDNQYDDARLSDFQNYFDKTWGPFKPKLRPAPGNHETYDPAGSMAGYRSYFGSIAYPQGKPYYSYDRGNWHFIALDSNTLTASAQLTWLSSDLAATTKGCIAAYWHHPLFSSGEHGNDPVSRQAWQLLYDAHADLVLNGHDHHYERFGPQNPSAAADPNGIVEVLGGMGGASPYSIVNVQPNSQKRLSGVFGVLKLSFTDSTFSWQLIGTDNAVKDTSPTYTCH